MAPGLSCSAACGIFPTQGWNLALPRCRQILRHWTTREAQESNVEIVAQGIHEDFERTSHAAPFSFPLWPGT